MGLHFGYPGANPANAYAMIFVNAATLCIDNEIAPTATEKAAAELKERIARKVVEVKRRKVRPAAPKASAACMPILSASGS